MSFKYSLCEPLVQFCCQEQVFHSLPQLVSAQHQSMNVACPLKTNIVTSPFTRCPMMKYTYVEATKPSSGGMYYDGSNKGQTLQREEVEVQCSQWWCQSAVMSDEVKVKECVPV